jgi:hypothetical protein
MPATPVHTKLLTAAAREVLRPMGLTQRGRSRSWIDDHGWWLIQVEFQPSGFTKGSYLNVGITWIWDEHLGFSFDFGNRVEGLVVFENERQFAPEAQRLAQRAASEVTAFRGRFDSIAKTANELTENCDPRNSRQLYHTGLACGLAGRTKEAAGFLRKLVEMSTTYAWEKELNARTAKLLKMVDQPKKFKAAVADIVNSARSSLKLEEIAPITFGE